MSQIVRPKGMPKAEWNAKSEKAKKHSSKRFLDFHTKIVTNQTNSGVQQYGAGQKLQTAARSANAGAGRRSVPSAAELRVGPKGSTVIRNRESLGKFVGGNPFVTDIFTIQPGIEAQFPWAAPVVARYERYSFIALKYIFIPTVSAFATGGASGRICLSCDYDAAEGPPSSMQVAESMDPHQAGLPYTQLELVLDSRRLNDVPKFTRSGPVAGAIQNYDAGTFRISGEGVNLGDSGTPVEVGEIFVEYAIMLLNPRIHELTVDPCLTVAVFGGSAHYSHGQNAGWKAATTLTLGANLGGSMAIGCLPVTVTNTSGNNTFTLPRGNYRLTYSMALGCNSNVFSTVYSRVTVDGNKYIMGAEVQTTSQVTTTVTAGDLFFVIPGATGTVVLEISTTTPTATGSWGGVSPIVNGEPAQSATYLAFQLV